MAWSTDLQVLLFSIKKTTKQQIALWAFFFFNFYIWIPLQKITSCDIFWIILTSTIHSSTPTERMYMLREQDHFLCSLLSH